YVLANADAHEPDPERRDARLRHIAESHLVRYMFSHSVDEWIGDARVKAGQQLRDRIAADAKAQNLGVQVLGVALAGVHPPSEVADAFHEVISAEQEKLAAIQQARQEAIRTVAETAGSIDLAHRIVEQIGKIESM